MSLNKLSSRAIIGEFYKRLNADDGMEWISAISNYFTSDQDTEEYAWIGQSPVMREWIGGRHAKGFTSNGISIENKHFEATIDIPVKHLRRDKTGQVKVRIGELATRTMFNMLVLAKVQHHKQQPRKNRVRYARNECLNRTTHQRHRTLETKHTGYFIHPYWFTSYAARLWQ